MKKKRKTRAVIYIRYSSHKQRESFSIEYQVNECTKFIEMNDYELVGTYIDEAKSGKKVAGRDAFDKMMNDAYQEKFDRIIVFSFSRSFRNTREALNANHELQEKHGIVIQSVIEPIDMTNPHGKFSGTNLFAMHELQSDIIAAHVKSGMYYAAQQGYYLGGTVPYGYELYGTGELSRGKERKRYRPNENEAKFVKELYAKFADGMSMTVIQKWVKEENIIGRKGVVITYSGLKQILDNPFYIGTIKCNFKGYDPLTIENAVPAIIDIDMWNKVRARRASKAQVSPRRTRRLYSLTGKIFCAKCGGHFYGSFKGSIPNKRDGWAYYLCKSKKSNLTCDAKNIRKDYIDAYCLKEIKNHILNEESMRAIAAQIATVAGNSSDEMLMTHEKAKKRKEKIQGILMKIKQEQYEEKITEEMATQMSANYNKELLELENAIQGLSEALESAITPEYVYSYLQDLLTLSGSDNDELQKMLFDKLIDRIIVHDDRIEVHLIVFPFARSGDSSLNGQPHYQLSLNTTRKALRTL